MSTESHLSLDATIGDYIVDMSNVVRDRSLGPDRLADLRRFSLLIDGLVAHAHDEGVFVFGVADWSLLRHRALDDDERATLKRWYRRGLIEVRDGADDRILELADATGMSVVSRDNYTDFCRPYPWVAGNRDRFLMPCPGPDGRTVSVRARTMPVPSEAQMSRKEEEGLLLQVGMYDREEFALGPGVTRGLRPTDEVVLVDGLELVLSARQFVFDEPAAESAAHTRLGREADLETALFLEPEPDGA